MTRGGRKKVSIFIFRLNGNSLEIARMMKNWILGRIIQNFNKQLQVISGKKWVSGYYLVSFRVIRDMYRDNMPVIYIYT